jgi:FkbM family methyltransferase
MKSCFRQLLRRYLAGCPVTEGKGFLYRRFSEILLPEDREAVVTLYPGFRMGLDLCETAQREIYYFGTYERKESAHIRRILRPGDVFWDIGANIGYYTLMGAACVGPEGRVVAFEPFPPAWERLQRNVHLNSFGQITCVNAAVSSAAGNASLFFERNIPDGVASLAAGESQKSSVACTTLTLDGFVSEFDERLPTLVKADVEGSERADLMGAVQILSSRRPTMLLMEMKEGNLARHRTSRAEIQEIMVRLGFAAFELKGRRWVACRDVRQAQNRNVFWMNPSDAAHRERVQAAGIGKTLGT